MSKKTIYLLGILFTILIGMWLQHYFCCSENCCQPASEPVENITEPETIVTEKPNFEQLDGFSFNVSNENFSTQDNFAFLNSKAEILTPISDSINLGIEKMKLALNNSDTKLNILGNYNSEEPNNSIFPDLGLARATAVKNYLVSKGINENKLMVSSIQNEALKNTDTIFSATQIALWVDTLESSQNQITDWEKQKAEINANPIRLYFQTGSSQINFTQSQKQQIHNIMEYVSAVEGAKILVVGHTDNVVGVNATNKVHSTRRANFVKEYLISNGINGTKIIAEGKADTQPIADNATEQGRAKNRRVEILVQ